MQTFYSQGFKGKELVCLNWCHLFLQVTTLADIVSADGKHIMHDAWHGHKDSLCLSYYSWPNQGDPATQDWNLWCWCLSLTFGSRQEQHLLVPLGSWIDRQIQFWIWFFTLEQDQLYECSGHTWKVYTLEGSQWQCMNKWYTFSGTSPAALAILWQATIFFLDSG